MSEPRIASHMLVSALRRKVEAVGGFATVIARGDKEAGSILLVCPQGHYLDDKNPAKPLILEREPTLEGPGKWISIADQHTDNKDKLSVYLARRRGSDPDLWIIELDVAEAERFAAEIISSA